MPRPATVMQIPMGVIADKQIKKAMSLNVISTMLYWGCVALVGTHYHIYGAIMNWLAKFHRPY